MVIRSIGRLALEKVQHVVDSNEEVDSEEHFVRCGVWLQRMFELFVVTCKKDEFYCQPDCEYYLFEVFQFVQNLNSVGDNTLKPLKLKFVVESLNRAFPDIQGAAIIKRSRLRLKRLANQM
jgi:hypothetical protein